LPGGVKVTIKLGHTSAGATTYSLPNIHGDIAATVNADGLLTGTFMTGPFGEKLTNTAFNSAINNTTSTASYQYLGQHQKLSESEMSINPIQMGARVYIGILGRFTSVDSKEGGTDNSYVYANNPISEFDLSGKNIFEDAWNNTTSFVKDNWQSIAVGAAIGVGCAATAGIGCALAVGAVAGGTVAMVSNVYETRETGIDVMSLISATAGGAVSGTVSGAIGYGVGKAVGTLASKVDSMVGRAAYNSQKVGVSSELFGNARFGTNGAGKLNNYGSIKVGWSFVGNKNSADSVFRVGFNLFGKDWHIDFFKGFKLW